MTCLCGRKRIPWGFYAALILAAVCVGSVIRNNAEYRAVRAVRVQADSLLADWMGKKCIPR